jgi:hypothetical protein
MMQKLTFLTDNLHVEWHGDKGSPVQKLHKVTFKKVLVARCHSFCLFLYFTIYIHSFNHSHTIHLSVAIRQSFSSYLHRCSAQWENLPVVPSRESNSGLPYSKPTLYPHHTFAEPPS